MTGSIAGRINPLLELNHGDELGYFSVYEREREKDGGKGAGTMTVKVIYLDASAALPYL